MNRRDDSNSLQLFVHPIADCGGQEGVIRLFNGSSASEGVVEYCDNSVWTPVCGDDWDETEAVVACRQLRFSGEGVATVNMYCFCWTLNLNMYSIRLLD